MKFREMCFEIKFLILLVYKAAFHHAIEKGNLEIVKLLVNQKGIDICIKSI